LERLHSQVFTTYGIHIGRKNQSSVSNQLLLSVEFKVWIYLNCHEKNTSSRATEFNEGIQYLLALGECCLISILWNLISSEKKLWFKGTNRVEADNGSGFQPIK
jgi:hypothetical protein